MFRQTVGLYWEMKLAIVAWRMWKACRHVRFREHGEGSRVAARFINN